MCFTGGLTCKGYVLSESKALRSPQARKGTIKRFEPSSWLKSTSAEQRQNLTEGSGLNTDHGPTEEPIHKVRLVTVAVIQEGVGHVGDVTGRGGVPLTHNEGLCKHTQICTHTCSKIQPEPRCAPVCASYLFMKQQAPTFQFYIQGQLGRTKGCSSSDYH